MTHTDNELFELCKSVYEKTKLEYFTKSYVSDGNLTVVQDGSIIFTSMKERGWFFIAPLYTSDYLLEKLQRPHTSVVFEYFESFITVIRYNEEDVYIRRESDTLLKALLKLVIALHDAGELTSMENK